MSALPFDDIRALIADAPLAADELIRRTGLSAGELAAALAKDEASARSAA